MPHDANNMRKTVFQILKVEPSKRPLRTLMLCSLVSVGNVFHAVRFIRNMARMRYFTESEAYAQKARDILIAWASTHTDFGGNESGLDLGDYAAGLSVSSQTFRTIQDSQASRESLLRFSGVALLAD